MNKKATRMIRRACRKSRVLLDRIEATTRDSRDSRKVVGGLWDEMGQLQFDFLISQGLDRTDRFLDVGCGSLRGGRKIVGYLDGGNYYGIDLEQWLLEAGRDELAKLGLQNKPINLRQTADFDVDFGVQFDFALAQSVFTHLPLNSIQQCLLRVEKALRPGAVLYATFFLADDRTSVVPQVHETAGGPLATYLDRDPFHYPVEAFEYACAGTTLEPRFINEWGHPRDQRMMAFHRR